MDIKDKQKILFRVRRELETIAEADYKKFSASLIPGVENLLGIRIPLLRDMAKKLAKEDWKGCMEWENTLYFEETMLQGLVLGYAKAPIGEILEYTRRFIPKIDNWSVNDTFCSNFKIARKEPEKVWDFLMTYKDSHDEFETRVVAVMLMDHYLDDAHIDAVLKVLGELEIVGYYTSMGVAWAYATAWAKYPEKTKTYLLAHPIDPETYHKTLRKCLESYRISDVDKEWIRRVELPRLRNVLEKKSSSQNVQDRKANIIKFKVDMQPQVDRFFLKCLSAVGIPYSPGDRHADVADVENHYMKNGRFWCLMNGDTIIGTVAIRVIDEVNKVVELKRMFVLPEYQGNGYGRLLLEYAISYAKEKQYQKMCLDTRKQFAVAQHLYRSVGFRETDKYNDNEHAELYFELGL